MDRPGVTLRQALARVWPLVPVIGALLFTSILLVIFDTSPFTAFEAMLDGALGDRAKRLSVLAFFVPLALSSIGLLITFRAGLWNIGVEGQIILGAVAASWLALKLDVPGPLLITLELLAAMAAGALWAALSAVFKTRGGVHEIFSGLALNNIAILQWDRGALGDATASYDRALSAYRELGDPSGIAMVRANLGELWRDRGDLARAEDLLQKAREAQEEIGESLAAAKTRALMALLWIDAGELDRAETTARQAAEILEEAPDDGALAWAVVGMARARQGNLRESRSAFELARELAAERSNPASAIWIEIERARHLVAASDPARAARDLESLVEESRRTGIRRLELLARRSRADALIAAGDPTGPRLLETVEIEARELGFGSPELFGEPR